MDAFHTNSNENDVNPTLKKALDKVYHTFNRPEYIHPDPLEFLCDYDRQRDREIVGLVASSLAYGRVEQIGKSVARILREMTQSPREFLAGASKKRLRGLFAGFKHRFTGAGNIVALLLGMKHAIQRHGTLHNCFAAGLDEHDETILPALAQFVCELKDGNGAGAAFLLPSPEKGSACKRLNLYLRWMVRCDAVDPGGWDDVPASKLIVPLDTHMFKISRALGFTRRSQADMKAALETTRAFREFSPEDPVRYDFALTRLGIRDDADMTVFLRECVTT